MCCYADEIAKKSLLRRFGSRQTMTLWKTIFPSGKAWMADYRYSPGEHIAKTGNGKAWKGSYSTGRPSGIHVYRRKPGSRWATWIPIRVVVRKEDLVCADSNQAVFRKIHITKKAWKEAGLPLEKVWA